MSDSLSVLPGWLSGFLEVFRQGTPAVYATTVYGICHWADSKASDEAKALIAYREKINGFKSLEEMKQVPGIDGKKIDAKKDRLVFGNAPPPST